MERASQIELTTGGPITLRLSLQPDHLSHAGRIEDAAREALNQYAEWFGPYPGDTLTIVDSAWRSPVVDTVSAGVVPIQARWLQPERSLTLEAQVARGIARQWWGVAVTVEDRFLADGLAEYLQGRTLERIFDRRHLRVNYSLTEVRVFNGLVPWAIRALRTDRETSGAGRAAWRAQPHVDLRSVDEAARPAQAAKVASALLTLERYIGWPAVHRGLRAAARRFAGGSMSATEFASTMSDATQRDLSWFFHEAFDRQAAFDFGIDALSSVPEASESCGTGTCYKTSVVLARYGEAMFTGTALPPVGEYESGRALTVVVTFADGQRSVEHWDGRATSRTLVYYAPAPAVSARIDPGRILMLDLRAINNLRSLPPEPVTAVLPWSVRWTTWLQDVLLSAAFFF